MGLPWFCCHDYLISKVRSQGNSIIFLPGINGYYWLDSSVLLSFERLSHFYLMLCRDRTRITVNFPEHAMNLRKNYSVERGDLTPRIFHPSWLQTHTKSISPLITQQTHTHSISPFLTADSHAEYLTLPDCKLTPRAPDSADSHQEYLTIPDCRLTPRAPVCRLTTRAPVCRLTPRVSHPCWLQIHIQSSCLQTHTQSISPILTADSYL